jgi:hypothetical protein
LLAAGEFEREALLVAGQPDEVQDFGDAGHALFARHAFDLEAEADVVADVHVGEQRIGLEHHADVALVGVEMGDFAPRDGDRAGGRMLEAGDHPEDGGLAAA